MSEIEKNNEEEKLDTSNIFDEFEVNDETREEIEKLTLVKDIFYYMKNIGGLIKYINFLLIIIIIIASIYIYIQKSDSNLVSQKNYLNPICEFLKPDGVSIGTDCSGVNNLNILLSKSIEEKEIEYLKKYVPILKDSYEIESVKNSKEALFLREKANNKNDPIEILNEFDKLKNKFTPVLKDRIVCDTIIIKGNILDAKCSSRSNAWDEKIPGLDGNISVNTINGTSITQASSFINFISNSDRFNNIDRQKIFEKKPYFGEGNYTYKTDFKIKIEYKKNDLSL